MKKSFTVLIGALLITIFSVTPSWSGELDILMDKLIEKGVFSPVEGQIILDETKQQVAKEVSEGKSYALPKWAQKMKIKQDIRIRYQWEKLDTDGKCRNRGRIRYRLGVINKPFKDIKVGFGLATGSDDPKSTNQTFTDGFSSTNIKLDYAYLQWKANKNAKLIAGKFKRKPYLWATTDMLWDSDINPEGFSFALNKDVSEVPGLKDLAFLKDTNFFLNGGIWVLDEKDDSSGPLKDSADPYMWHAQMGKKWKKGDFDGKLAVIIYKFSNVEGNTLDDSEGTNTTSGGVLANDYDAKVVSAEVGIKNPLGLDDLGIERFAIFGDYVKNVRWCQDHMG